MGALEIIAFALANAPAAIDTFGKLKDLILGGFEEVKATISDDATIEEARAQVLTLMDQIAAKSKAIQDIP